MNNPWAGANNAIHIDGHPFDKKYWEHALLFVAIIIADSTTCWQLIDRSWTCLYFDLSRLSSRWQPRLAHPSQLRKLYYSPLLFLQSIRQHYPCVGVLPVKCVHSHVSFTNLCPLCHLDHYISIRSIKKDIKISDWRYDRNWFYNWKSSLTDNFGVDDIVKDCANEEITIFEMLL